MVLFRSTEGNITETTYKLAIGAMVGGLKKTHQYDYKAERALTIWRDKLVEGPDPRELAVMAALSGRNTLDAKQLAYITGLEGSEIKNATNRMSHALRHSREGGLDGLNSLASQMLNLLS